MTAEKRTVFAPDYGPKKPGEHLRMFLDERGIKIVDFARRTGRPTKTISEIISGKASITPETALQFERVLGEGAGFWLALEAKYQLALARQKETETENEQEALVWARQFPFPEMIKLGFFDKRPKPTEIVGSVLRAFSVSSIAAWERHWRERIDLSRLKQQTHNQNDPFAVAAWLRRAELLADSIETEPYNEAEFRALLPNLKALSLSPWSSAKGNLINICAGAGVAVAMVPSVAKTGLRGAAYWARKDKAVIVISDRLKFEENVWFSFFHEACHILEHSKKAVFIDSYQEGTGGRDIEREADEFSAEMLVPKAVIEKFQSVYGTGVRQISQPSFKRFSQQNGVSPGLLLMRLQHHEIVPRNSKLSKLKRKVEFTVESVAAET
ncbi:HigA family addiction module antitoxin [Roseobacter sp.]|uniref:HigA family addiction module antitoxin n=1 Tax=Roseobacter sp. TaxID=1907202 RepID=UPI002966C778|nr:HigA family addiction module antitoxin [Roseobacter sp.]MDW3181475.1 HigA family addiction module antitoxin [Roseobacter sp.]